LRRVRLWKNSDRGNSSTRMMLSLLYRQKFARIFAVIIMSFLLIFPERLFSGMTETYEYRVDFIVVPSVDLKMKI